MICMIQVETKPSRYEKPRRQKNSPEPETTGAPTVIGWQGIRFRLPPDWNLTGFSMNRENGYLRVDAPGDTALTVQVRWMNAARPEPAGPPNVYSFAAPYVRKWLRRPTAVVPKPNLRANLERLLKDTAKEAKKSKAAFESAIKTEKIEGENGERKSLSFSWTGQGRGQGKIWHCETCNRVVVAQVIGLAKDQSAIATVASQLFATLQDHAIDGYDRWALYDLQIDVPEDFRLEEQKLLSGHLHLAWGRGAERIVLERWGLANITLKKFTLAEWFRSHALMRVGGLSCDETHTVHGHESVRYTGSLSLAARLHALRNSKMSLQRFPSRYEGGIWNCALSNKLFAVQTLCHRRTEGLWEDVVSRCVCHAPGQAALNSAEEADTDLLESQEQG